MSVYIFTSKSLSKKGLYKIGYVQNYNKIKRRETELSCGNPDGKMICCWHSDEPKNLEKNMHTKMKMMGRHHKREWYNFISINHAIDFLTSIAKKPPDIYFQHGIEDNINFMGIVKEGFKIVNSIFNKIKL